MKQFPLKPNNPASEFTVKKSLGFRGFKTLNLVPD